MIPNQTIPNRSLKPSKFCILTPPAIPFIVLTDGADKARTVELYEKKRSCYIMTDLQVARATENCCEFKSYHVMQCLSNITLPRHR